MARREPHWDEWRTFREVARDGSLSGAARRLGLAQPTVGRHIDALEAALGLTLFTRSPRGLQPTTAAAALAPHSEAMAAAAAALSRLASGEAEADRGIVRVTASEIVGAEALPPILAAFRRDYPGVTIELNLSNRNEDLAQGAADVAVRMTRPTQSGLIARKLGVVRIGLYARRDYLERCGEPRALADLANHCLIGFDRDADSLRAFGASASGWRREMFGFRSDSDLAQLAALRAGVGVGGAQAPIARRSPDLVPVLPNAFRLALDMWLVMHRALRATPRVRRLYDALAAGLTDYLKGR